MKNSTIAIAVLMTVLSLRIFAEAPAEGLVIEGVSVPGVALGDSRSQVNAEYGSPLFCQSTSIAGNRGSCSYRVAQGGQVNVVFEDESGSPATGLDSDRVSIIRWNELVTGWVTTENITADFALASPESVAAVYPDAIVFVSDFFGIARIVDEARGINISRHMDFYGGTLHVSMSIFEPREPTLEPPEEEVNPGNGNGGKKGKNKGKK